MVQMCLDERIGKRAKVLFQQIGEDVYIIPLGIIQVWPFIFIYLFYFKKKKKELGIRQMRVLIPSVLKEHLEPFHRRCGRIDTIDSLHVDSTLLDLTDARLDEERNHRPIARALRLQAHTKRLGYK